MPNYLNETLTLWTMPWFGRRRVYLTKLIFEQGDIQYRLHIFPPRKRVPMTLNGNQV